MCPTSFFNICQVAVRFCKKTTQCGGGAGPGSSLIIGHHWLNMGNKGFVKQADIVSTFRKKIESTIFIATLYVILFNF